VDPSEDCDGANTGDASCTQLDYYDDSPLSCTDNCRFDDTGCTGFCGDGKKNGSESCDGPDLVGATCTDFGFYDSAGLSCSSSSCTYDTSACAGFCGDGIVNGEEICDQSKPGTGYCRDFGFDFGPAQCSGLCGVSFAACEHIGWVREPTQTGGWISGLAASRDAMWATANAEVLRRESSGWSTAYTASAPLLDLWAGGDDVVAVGQNGITVRFDGANWIEQTTGTETLNAVWAVGPNDIYAAGNKGAITHFDGTSWSAQESGTVARMAHLWGSGPNDIYALGPSNQILHSDGSTWTSTTVPFTANSLWGTGPANLYATAGSGALWHYNGSTWTVIFSDPTAAVSSVWGRGPNDVYVAGTSFSGGALNGEIHHFDGHGWLSMTLPFTFITRLGGTARRTFTGGVLGDIWALDRLWWAPVLSSNAGDLAGWARDRGALVVTSGWKAWHYDGARRTERPLPWLSPKALWGAGPNDVYAVGNVGIAHFNGSAWAAIPSRYSALLDVFGLGTDDVDAVGSEAGQSVVAHVDGGTWQTVHTSSSRLSAIWASSPTDVFAAGDSGALDHFDGTTWTPMDSGTDQALLYLSGTGPSDVYAAGGPTLIHFDGAVWAPVEVGIYGNFYGLWANASDDVYVSMQQGIEALLHFDGSRWSAVRLRQDGYVSNIWGASGHLFVHHFPLGIEALSFRGPTSD